MKEETTMKRNYISPVLTEIDILSANILLAGSGSHSRVGSTGLEGSGLIGGDRGSDASGAM